MSVLRRIHVSIRQIILLSTPTIKHPLCLHKSQQKIYSDIREQLLDIDQMGTMVISISGGASDLQIHPETTTFHNLPPSKYLHYIFTPNIFQITMPLEAYALTNYQPLIEVIMKWLVLSNEEHELDPTRYFTIGLPHYERNYLHRYLAISTIRNFEQCDQHRPRGNEEQTQFLYSYAFAAASERNAHGLTVYSKHPHFIGCHRFLFHSHHKVLKNLIHQKQQHMIIRTSLPTRLLRFLIVENQQVREVYPYTTYFQESIYVEQFNSGYMVVFVDLEETNAMIRREHQGIYHEFDRFYYYYKRHNPHYLTVLFDMAPQQIQVPFQPGNKIDIQLNGGFAMLHLDSNDFNSIVPIKICVFKQSDSHNNTLFNYVYNVLILKQKDAVWDRQMRLDQQISYNHSDCVHMDLVDGQSKEILIFPGEGYPSIMDAHNTKLNDEQRTDLMIPNQKSREHNYLTVYYDVINFVGLIARNNRQIIFTLQVIYSLLLWLLLMKRYAKKDEKYMPNQSMAIMKFFYQLFFTISILLYLITWCRSLLWSDAIKQQTVYLTNDNIFSVEAYFASYQGFSVFFAIVSIGSLLCFSLVFLVNSYVLEYLAKFIHLIWRFIFKRKMAWLTPRVWKGWILVAVAVGYAFGQVKWISLLGFSQLLHLFIKLGDACDRTKRLQESVIFINWHFFLLNSQQVLLYMTDNGALSHHTADLREYDYEYYAHLCWFYVAFNVHKLAMHDNVLIQCVTAAAVTLLLIVAQQQVVFLAGQALLLMPYFLVTSTVYFQSILVLKGGE